MLSQPGHKSAVGPSAAGDRQAPLPGLDGLRALACLLVFGVHFGQATGVQGHWGVLDLGLWLKNGNTGVALFFALSGFVLSLPFGAAGLDAGARPRLLAFWLRRLARIVPAYFLCLTALLLANRYWLKQDVGLDVLLHFLFLFNFREASVFSINPPFWTLAVEMQFYLLLPLFLWIVRSAYVRRSAAGLVLMALAAYGLHLALSSSVPAGQADSPVIAYSLLAHLPHFLLGSATAMLYLGTLESSQGTGTLPTFWSGVLLLALSLMMVIMASALDGWLRIPFGRYNLPYLPLLLCLIIVLTPHTVLGRALFDNFVMRYLGTVSFGVYLFHQPLLNLTGRWMTRIGMPRQEWPISFGLISLTLTVGLAATSYLLMERPVMRAVRHYQSK